jgi:predicted  nucleic acid-binding Zn-ribbon protein
MKSKELESQSSVEIELLRDQLRNLEENLEESKQSKDYLEQDIRGLRQQLDYAQEDAYKQKTNINNKLQEKEMEIEKLRNQVCRSME